MRHITLPVVAGAMILLGLYFFPLGEDVVFKTLLDSSGGDYWLARFYQYVIFGLLIVTGFLLLRYGVGGIMNPYFIVGIAILLVFVSGVV